MNTNKFIELKNNELLLLEFLSKQINPISSNNLSKALNISSRTVKNYVNNINFIYPCIITSSQSGYYISDINYYKKIQNEQIKNRMPNNFEGRKNYILKKLLLTDKEYDTNFFIDKLFISYETLMSDIIKIRKILLDFELSLNIKNDILSVEGTNLNKRNFISNSIKKESQNSVLSISFLQEYFPTYDLKKLSEIINDVVNKHEYFIDDYSLLNLVLHLAIAMERNNIYYDNNRINEEKVIIDQDITEIISDICYKINEEFNISFKEHEKYYFSLIIMTRIVSHSLNKLDINQVKKIVDNDVLNLVNKIKVGVYNLFDIDLGEEDFFVRFVLHTNNLMQRLKNKIIINNLEAQNIKRSYPFIHDVSVYIANIIYKETEYRISEDEISYIALHIGVLIEEQRAGEEKVKVVFLHQKYYFNNFDTVKRCMNHFSNILVVGSVCFEEDIEKFPYYDLIITTVPLKNAYGAHTVQVSNMLGNNDLKSIKNSIDYVLKQKWINNMKNQFSKLFNENLFYYTDKSLNKNEVIDILCKKLEDNKNINNEFKEKIIERENISPSAYANVAMPHPLEMLALKSAVAISLHPNPIKWNSNEVNIVFMIASTIEDKKIIKELFDLISTIIIDSEKVITLSNSKSYAEFINILISNLEKKK